MLDSKKLRTYLTEGVAIVVRIRLAVAIDGWRSDDRGAQRVMQKLRALRAERQANRQNILERTEWDRDVDGAIGDLRTLAPGSLTVSENSYHAPTKLPHVNRF
jgi:hypothetical protein